MISFVHRGVASAAHARKISDVQVAGVRAHRDSLRLFGLSRSSAITFKTLDEIDFLASPGKDVAGTIVCAGGDSNFFLILPGVAEASQDFDGPSDYTKNCRTTDFTF